MVVANKGSKAATALRNGGALQLLVVICVLPRAQNLL